MIRQLATAGKVRARSCSTCLKRLMTAFCLDVIIDRLVGVGSDRRPVERHRSLANTEAVADWLLQPRETDERVAASALL